MQGKLPTTCTTTPTPLFHIFKGQIAKLEKELYQISNVFFKFHQNEAWLFNWSIQYNGISIYNSFWWAKSTQAVLWNHYLWYSSDCVSLIVHCLGLTKQSVAQIQQYWGLRASLVELRVGVGVLGIGIRFWAQPGKCPFSFPSRPCHSIICNCSFNKHIIHIKWELWGTIL